MAIEMSKLDAPGDDEVEAIEEKEKLESKFIK